MTLQITSSEVVQLLDNTIYMKQFFHRYFITTASLNQLHVTEVSFIIYINENINNAKISFQDICVQF